MRDFIFLKDLEQTSKHKPANQQVEAATNEIKYLIYKLIENDSESEIGVPLDMVDAFDIFINENDADKVLNSLGIFNAIRID